MIAFYPNVALSLSFKTRPCCETAGAASSSRVGTADDHDDCTELMMQQHQHILRYFLLRNLAGPTATLAAANYLGRRPGGARDHDDCQGEAAPHIVVILAARN